MEKEADLDLTEGRAPPRSHDARAAQEAARGRQPVPAHGQRRHHARGALPAPPARSTAGSRRCWRRRPPGRRQSRPACAWSAPRCRGPGSSSAAASAAPASTAGSSCPTPTSPWVAPAVLKGRDMPARRALRRHLLELAAAQRAPRRGHAGALDRSAVAGRLPRPVVHLPVPHVPDARRTAPPTPASRRGRCAAPPPSRPSTSRSSTTCVARHPWLAGRAHVLPNGFDRAETPDDVDLGDGFWLVHTGRLYGREQQVERVPQRPRGAARPT